MLRLELYLWRVAVKFITVFSYEICGQIPRPSSQFHRSKVVKSTLRIKIILPDYDGTSSQRWVRSSFLNCL